MTGKDLYEAIHQCDDEYIEKTAERIEKNLEKRSLSSKGVIPRLWRHSAAFRTAAAIFLCIVALGMGVSVLATASDAFREWLFDMFSGHEVTELHIGSEGGAEEPGDTDEPASTKETSGETSQPDIPADENHRISLKDNMLVFGDKETVVAETHYDEETENVKIDRVYGIQGNGLKELPVYSFQGEYDGVLFSFEYAICHQEIHGFNLEGAINEVFSYFDEKSVYVQLMDDGENYKECIAKLDLETGIMEKLSSDKVYANCTMSPGGKVILCNYRADGYWTVFDLKEKTEKRIEAINAYTRGDEIEFLDDTTILTFGEDLLEKTDDGIRTQAQTCKVDLRTGQVLETYTGYGEAGMEWNSSVKKNTLELTNIVTGETFSIEGADKNTHFLGKAGDYAMYGDKEENNSPYFLVNLAKKTFMKIDVPQEMHFDVEMYLAGAEKKLLLANETEAYIVDVSELE
ncbi:hypothetical protein BN3660_01225 [Eubacteriaceae bacterium CHKCI004]|nr:hypothetical protein BN3660_01225 [Eubacteriaceae bacterium CHKCI004]